MTRMVRKQLYIDEAQDAFLQRESDRLGLTQADIVRHAIDQLRSKASTDARTVARAEIESLWSELSQDSGEPYRFRRGDAYEGGRGR